MTDFDRVEGDTAAADRGYARLHGARALRQAACPVAAWQEEQHGLYVETATIGTRTGWQARLAAAGLTLRGHRVVRG